MVRGHALSVHFAIPGDLTTPSGGYGYARRLLREAPGLGLEMSVLALPDGFPNPNGEALARTAVTLGGVRDGVILADGLAWGALPDVVLDQLRVPVVALCHHPLAFETGVSPERAAELQALETQALSRAQHVITTSNATADSLRRHYHVPGAVLTVAQPGTDPAPRAPADGPGRLLAVGSVTPRKGHDRLVAALAQMADLDWTLRIVGPRPDPQALAHLTETIAQAGLEERITLSGPMGLPALTAAYQGADLFVLASGYEGFGMAFTEAMAHGLPVLGLASPAVEEATAGGALLVAPDAFADALRTLLADAHERRALADRCWTTAQTLLRWPQTAAIVAGVLREAGA